MKSVLRSCVLCGAANDGEFLKDSTGSRRFLVFPVPQLIDTKQLSAEVDQLWAEAVRIFSNTSIREREEQCLWWLTPEEAIQEQINNDYTTTDSLEEKVLKALREKTNPEKGFKMSALIESVYGYRAEWYQDDVATSWRLGKILTKLKYHRKTARDEEGNPVKLWFPPSK